MNVATSNKTGGIELGAAVFAPVAPEEFYETLLDVRGFPAWAPGVRRVEVISGEGAAGMLSEWEVSLLGLKRRVISALEDAEAPCRLRWTYAGPVEGWGACSIEGSGDGAVAVFRTQLAPADPLLARLARGALATNAARGHLKLSLARLGRLVAGNEERVMVGPVVEGRQSGIRHHAGNTVGAGFEPARAHRAR
jgi:polyketide cyclase/dehydrase/lipid transport protein